MNYFSYMIIISYLCHLFFSTSCYVQNCILSYLNNYYINKYVSDYSACNLHCSTGSCNQLTGDCYPCEIGYYGSACSQSKGNQKSLYFNIFQTIIF